MLNNPPDPESETDDVVDAAGVRETLLAAFHVGFKEIGGVRALVEWGRTHPGDFYAAFARLVAGAVSAGREPWAYVSSVPIERGLTAQEWEQSVKRRLAGEGSYANPA